MPAAWSIFALPVCSFENTRNARAAWAARVRSVRVRALFDKPVDGVMLSDHDGLLVDYELSWTVEGAR